MIAKPATRASPKLLLKYLATGTLSVVVDASVYWGMLALTGNPLVAKPVGYVSGAVFSYFANWRFTFGQRRGRFSEVAFVVVYVSSLFVNLGINELGLTLLSAFWWKAPASFLAATAVTTVLNFLGQYFFVFREADRDASLGET